MIHLLFLTLIPLPDRPGTYQTTIRGYSALFAPCERGYRVEIPQLGLTLERETLTEALEAADDLILAYSVF